VKDKQYLYIHDRKEVFVLALLMIMISVFTFTLGVHLGKRVGGKTLATGSENIPTVHPLADQIPNRQELNEQAQGTPQAVEEIITEDLQKEVTRAGLKIATQHQVDLPENPKNANAGATTLTASKTEKEIEKHPEKKAETGSKSVTHGKYTLQIGSFPSQEEAKKHLSAMSQTEPKPFLREAEVKGKGKWYRLYLGGYPDRDAAAKAGEKFRAQRKISSFIVSKLAE